MSELIEKLIENASHYPCLHPGNCGDGANPWDCPACMAKRIIQDRKEGKRPRLRKWKAA